MNVRLFMIFNLTSAKLWMVLLYSALAKAMADDEKTDFQKKLTQIEAYGKISACIALGNRLHLFEALTKVGSEQEPASFAQVAEECGCKERYVREWLAVMGTADIITVTEEEKFYIKEEHVTDLTDSVYVVSHSFLPNALRPYDKLSEVFKKDGPYGLEYSDFSTEFYDIMAKYSETAHKKHLIPDYLPALGSDVKERLEAGGMVCLDVGCGKGFHAALLAENFPSSQFTGIDITQDAIDLASQKRKENGEPFENLSFIQMDASKMDPDWTCKFDLVTIFDACHDQMRPDLNQRLMRFKMVCFSSGKVRAFKYPFPCLREIYRILKNEGMFAMLEVDGTSNIYKDKEQMGLSAASGYADSLFNCLPIGSNSEDALGLGAMWGRERAMKMLNEVGFADVSIVPAPFFKYQVLYVCKKC